MTIAAEYANKTGWRLRFSRQLLTWFATVGDQTLAAAANFWLTISIGRAFAAEDLAAYGIGLSAGLIIQALQRHALIIPFMLEPRSRSQRRAGGMIGLQWIILAAAFIAGAAGVLAGERLDAPHYMQLVIGASAVCFVIYAELEFARAILVKLGTPLSLLAGSLYYAVLFAGLGSAVLMEWIGFPALLLSLAAGMTLHAVGVSLRTGAVRIGQGWALLCSHSRRYGVWSIVATGTAAGYTHIPLLILGLLNPPIHAAAFVATRSLMQPLQVLIRGLDIADKAGFAERPAAPHGRGGLHLALKLAGTYALVGSIFGLAVCFFADTLLQLAYGSKFAGEGAALMAWVPVFILISCMMPIESLVYARRSFKAYYLARAAGSAVALGLAALLVFRFSEAGAILASAAGSFVAAAGAVLLLARGSRG